MKQAPNRINGMVCCLGSLGVERARECVSRVSCHGSTGRESGLGGACRGNCLTGNDVFRRCARGSLGEKSRSSQLPE